MLKGANYTLQLLVPEPDFWSWQRLGGCQHPNRALPYFYNLAPYGEQNPSLRRGVEAETQSTSIRRAHYVPTDFRTSLCIGYLQLSHLGRLFTVGVCEALK